MEQNKIRTYFFYAIGEILLVVIGILIALQVNTWNENRQKRIEETYYLEKLIENIEADSVLVQNLLSFQRIIASSVDSALIMMASESEFEPDKFSEHLNAILGVQSFKQNSVTYDNLIASGKISYISEQQLVNSLFTYYDPGNEFRNWDDAARHYTRNVFGPFILENYYLTSGGLNAGSLNENYAALDSPEFTYEQLRGNQQLLNNLNMKYRLVTGQIEVYSTTITTMQTELLKNLRSALKGQEN